MEQLLANPLGELADASLDAVPYRKSPYYGLDVHLHMTVCALPGWRTPHKPSLSQVTACSAGLWRRCSAHRCACSLLRRQTLCLCRCTRHSWARAGLRSQTSPAPAAQRTGRRRSGSASWTIFMQSTSSICHCWVPSRTGCRCARSIRPAVRMRARRRHSRLAWLAAPVCRVCQHAARHPCCTTSICVSHARAQRTLWSTVLWPKSLGPLRTGGCVRVRCRKGLRHAVWAPSRMPSACQAHHFHHTGAHASIVQGLIVISSVRLPGFHLFELLVNSVWPLRQRRCRRSLD